MEKPRSKASVHNAISAFKTIGETPESIVSVIWVKGLSPSDHNLDDYIGSRKDVFRFQIGSRIFAKVPT